MFNRKEKLCKTKKCNNPVLDGKYCVNCTQTNKERNKKIVAGAGTTAATVATATIVAHKTGLLKKLPGAAMKIAQLILKK